MTLRHDFRDLAREDAARIKCQFGCGRQAQFCETTRGQVAGVKLCAFAYLCAECRRDRVEPYLVRA